MKQIAQNYKSGELTVLDVPAPVCRPGGVLVRSLPDQVKKVIDQVQKQGLVTTYKKVMNKLDS